MPCQTVVINRPRFAAGAQQVQLFPPKFQCLFTLAQAPSDDGRLSRCGDVARGLPVSLGGLLEELHVECPVGHQLLHPGVPFLQGLDLLGRLRSHASAFRTPAFARLLRDLQSPAGLGDLLGLIQGHTRLPKLLDHLVCGETSASSSSESPFRATPGYESFHQD